MSIAINNSFFIVSLLLNHQYQTGESKIDLDEHFIACFTARLIFI